MTNPLMAPIQIGRPLRNHREIRDLVRSLGIGEPDPEGFQVILAKSADPLDWSDPALKARMSPLIIPARRFTLLRIGTSSIAIALEDPALHARHRQICTAGYIHDAPAYQPHMLLGQVPFDDDLPEQVSLTRPLVLGAEYRRAPG